jgi:hypothetical protein
MSKTCRQLPFYPYENKYEKKRQKASRVKSDVQMGPIVLKQEIIIASQSKSID